MRYRSVDVITAHHVGQRVTIRRRLAEGGYSDVIGVLEHADESSVAVRDRHGERFEIRRSDIAAARIVRRAAPPRTQN